MKSRARVAGALGIAAVAAAALAWYAWRPSSAADGPIIIISIDTLRADHLPVYGYRAVPTPAIDALAADGIVFDRAYAHSPQTLPSHASILSGRLPFEHGVRDNIGFSVRPDEVLLPRLLSARGFASAGIVSAYVLRKETSIGQGFDLFDSQLPIASPEASIGQVQRDGAESLAVAERWLDTLHSPRFFLFLHFYEPHKPYTPPARYAHYQAYDGEIAYADELVGRSVQSLRARKLYDRATIVLLSDHGEGLGDHGEQEHGVFIYDESIRVPLIVKLPGSARRGRRVTQPVQHLDLVPTLLDLVGAEPRPGLRGRSLRPLLEGTGGVRDEGIYSESLYPRYHFGWSELTALTEGRYRLIRAPRDELYDLQEDPREKRNLAGDRPQTRLAMRAALDRLLAGAAIHTPTRVSDEDRERLQALGYVGMQAELPTEAPGSTLPDPKDKIHVLEMYRAAVDLAGARRFSEAAALFRKILDENRAMTDVWVQLANVLARSGLMDEAVTAYKRIIEINPTNTNGLIGAAAGLLKLRRLDEAQAHAELAAKVTPAEDSRSRAAAYETLMKIALARRDGEAARRYATLAQETDPTLPMSTYVQGLLLHAGGRYAEALPFFENTLQQLRGRTLTLTEAHFYTGDALARLERYAEAEQQFLEEVKLFPQNSRARASLAMLYRASGRDVEAERAVEGILQSAPTLEGYVLAARLWTIFGEDARADGVRARALREFSATEVRRAFARPAS